MKNFTVGPVEMEEEIRKIGGEQIPYFRTEEFSKVIKENEKLILSLAKAKNDEKAIFLTGSGTLGMEATILNSFTKKDKVLVINGGSFGQRFVEICKTLEIPYKELKLEYGCNLKYEDLEKFKSENLTGILVNAHETSTGVLYDLEIISKFAKLNNLFFVVDAISSFISDELNFTDLGIDIMITGSQKALALPPGIAILILSQKAIKTIRENKVKTLYCDIKKALENSDNGQTPFTPAISILLQLNMRLKKINEIGIENERKKIKELAKDFRNKIENLPFKFFTKTMSNTLTAIQPKNINISAYDIFLELKNNYNIWVCPNGGELKEKVLRVGHIGALKKEDNDLLIKALVDMQRRGLL